MTHDSIPMMAEPVFVSTQSSPLMKRFCVSEQPWFEYVCIMQDERSRRAGAGADTPISRPFSHIILDHQCR